MKRWIKWLGIGLAAVFLALQFFQPPRQPHDGRVNAADLRAVYELPAELRLKLEVACYDCHSDQTRYPWYAYIQPFGWWLAGHIEEGKEELNLSTFGSLSPRRQRNQLEAIIDEVWERKMPLKSYTWTHADAVFSDDEIDLVVEWGEALIDRIADGD